MKKNRMAQFSLTRGIKQLLTELKAQRGNERKSGIKSLKLDLAEKKLEVKKKALKPNTVHNSLLIIFSLRKNLASFKVCVF